ncbi:MAG TPA: hypothetical protein VF119_05615, partial [Candidatus Limnocylindrales bacterium]
DAAPAAEAPAEPSVESAAVEPAGTDPAAPVEETEHPAMIDAAPAAPDPTTAVEAEASTGPATTAPSAAPTAALTRKPNKFMADLTKAMQAAAESAREESFARLNSDAKSVIEEIHALSATESSELRKRADDDVAGIREWSKTEIARIREETDERIAHRKDKLEREIEEHAAAIEARIERVQGRVTAFEGEMAAFFERLLAEQDPTRFAALAESLPEPPTLDAATGASAWEPTPVVSFPSPAPVEEPEVAHATAVETPVETTVAPDPDWQRDPAWDATPAPAALAEPAADAWATSVAEAPEMSEPVEAVAHESEPAADTGDLSGLVVEAASNAETDPRIAMLGMSPDFAAAEAEAATFEAADDASYAPVAEIAEADIEARLAGLVTPSEGASQEVLTTRVVVTGLVSVASIAGFKRHLSRAPGVQSVGVSSGPDGEFVFAVGHGSDIALRDVVPALPGFGARVIQEVEGEIKVAAHDPETEG